MRPYIHFYIPYLGIDGGEAIRTLLIEALPHNVDISLCGVGSNDKDMQTLLSFVVPESDSIQHMCQSAFDIGLAVKGTINEYFNPARVMDFGIRGDSDSPTDPHMGFIAHQLEAMTGYHEMFTGMSNQEISQVITGHGQDPEQHSKHSDEV